MKTITPLKWLEARDISHALLMSGDCPCGEHSHTTKRSRAPKRGYTSRDHYTTVCASCERPLADKCDRSVLAAIYDYSPAIREKVGIVSAIILATNLSH